MTGPRAWSYSALSTYLSVCTLKYFFRYVVRAEPERTFSRMHFGLAVHAALEAAYKAWKAGDTVPLDVAQDTLKGDLAIRFQDPRLEFKQKETPEGLLTEGAALLETWAAQAEFEEVIATESEFTVPIVDPATGEVIEDGLRGWFDLVVNDPESGDPVVVDFKTSARRYSPTQLEQDLQARIYGYALRELYGVRRARLRWDVLVRNKKPVIQKIEAVKGPEDDARLFRLVQVAETGVAGGVFFPNDGSMWCGGCPYSDACARWHEDPNTFRDESDDPITRRQM